MNANELADELMKFYNLEENTAPIQIYDLAATMLRQQQAEIEHLKQLFGCDPAYYEKSAKTLTDEEIKAIGMEHLEVELFDEGEYGMQSNIYGMVEFARAILRKASE